MYREFQLYLRGVAGWRDLHYDHVSIGPCIFIKAFFNRITAHVGMVPELSVSFPWFVDARPVGGR
jgi:hypothetical protein